MKIYQCFSVIFFLIHIHFCMLFCKQFPLIQCILYVMFYFIIYGIIFNNNTCILFYAHIFVLIICQKNSFTKFQKVYLLQFISCFSRNCELGWVSQESKLNQICCPYLTCSLAPVMCSKILANRKPGEDGLNLSSSANWRFPSSYNKSLKTVCLQPTSLEVQKQGDGSTT